MSYLWNTLNDTEREQYAKTTRCWEQMSRMQRYEIVKAANHLIMKLSDPDEIRSAIARARHFRHDFEDMYDY